jgi:hypothetical protein
MRHFKLNNNNNKILVYYIFEHKKLMSNKIIVNLTMK